MGCFVCGLRRFVRALLLGRRWFVCNCFRRLVVRRLVIPPLSGDDLPIMASDNLSLYQRISHRTNHRRTIHGKRTIHDDGLASYGTNEDAATV